MVARYLCTSCIPSPSIAAIYARNEYNKIAWILYCVLYYVPNNFAPEQRFNKVIWATNNISLNILFRFFFALSFLQRIEHVA